MSAQPIVEIKTSRGVMQIELYPEKAPKTVSNFLEYVNSAFFDGTIFHRVISNFMIQGGGFTTDMEQKTTRPAIAIEADNGLKNKKGSVAMARTSDPNSATSQFFINLTDNDFLNHRSKSVDGWGYCVFGELIQGEDVLMQIGKVATTSRNGHQDVPAEPVIIESVTVIENKS